MDTLLQSQLDVIKTQFNRGVTTVDELLNKSADVLIRNKHLSKDLDGLNADLNRLCSNIFNTDKQLSIDVLEAVRKRTVCLHGLINDIDYITSTYF